MILKSIPTKTFDISYDSDTQLFTLLKKTGQTWHKVELTQSDLVGVLDLLKDMGLAGLLSRRDEEVAE